MSPGEDSNSWWGGGGGGGRDGSFIVLVNPCVMGLVMALQPSYSTYFRTNSLVIYALFLIYLDGDPLHSIS